MSTAPDLATDTAEEQPLREVDVLVVGAGVSGIDAAYRLQQLCPDHSYAVLEARDRLGGTWDLFRYPGVRSDSDVFTFSYSFHPWRGRQSLADGEDIRRYLEEVVAEHGLDRHLHLGTRVESASWSSEQGRWRVRTRTADGPATWSCRFLFACAGYYAYDRGHTPHFPGQEDFRGRLVHPQAWPEDLDCAGRRVVVIGSGATAVSLVPALAGTAAHVTMLQRSPTWMIAAPRHDRVADRLRRRLPAPLAHRLIRVRNLTLTQGFYHFSRRRPELARRFLHKPLVARLGAEYTAQHLTPRYAVWDQRLCAVADGDLLDAVQRGDASIVTDAVECFLPEGIRLASGRVLEADVVVTATGLRMELLGQARLDVDGEPVRLSEHMVYRGCLLDGVPNFALAVGYTNASWSLRSDLTSRYVCRLLRHLRSHHLRAAYPVRSPGERPRPLLGLTSGYVERARDILPSQGSSPAWSVPQNYPLDLVRMRRADVTEDMHFEPEPEPEPEPASRRRVEATAR